MKRIGENLFFGICFFFSAVLLVLSLFGAVRLAELSETTVAMEAEAAALRTENQIRRAEYESMLCLPEIERYATEVLGMQHCSPEQIAVAHIEK